MQTKEKCEFCDEHLDDCDDITTRYNDAGDIIYYHDDCYLEQKDMEYEASCEAREASRYSDDDDYLIDGVGFADPGGHSALRAETDDNPRNLPCPTCGSPNRLTPLDRARGYQCNSCADKEERGW